MMRDKLVICEHRSWRCGFNRSVRVDDWLLYAMDSPSASGARGFTRGSVFCARRPFWSPALRRKALIRVMTQETGSQPGFLSCSKTIIIFLAVIAVPGVGGACLNLEKQPAQRHAER